MTKRVGQATKGWFGKFAGLAAGAALLLTACGQAPNEEQTASSGESNRTYAEGTYYRVLSSPVQQDQPEPFIVEYLWVGCPACQRFEPVMQGVKAEFPAVNVIRRHGVFNQRWALDARFYHAASEIAGRDIGTAMLAFYQAQAPELPDFNDISVFLRQQGLDEEAVFDKADSPEIVAIMEQTLAEMQENQIPGVPAVVVNGRYLVANPLPEDIVTLEDYTQLIAYLLSLN